MVFSPVRVLGWEHRIRLHEFSKMKLKAATRAPFTKFLKSHKVYISMLLERETFLLFARPTFLSATTSLKRNKGKAEPLSSSAGIGPYEKVLSVEHENCGGCDSDLNAIVCGDG
jgi:hypothetical protein